MFETAELGRTTSKSEYEKLEPRLRTALLELQTQARERKIASYVLVNGVDGAGKGDAVNLLHEWMDPRYLRTFTFDAPSDEERARPEYWRYWTRLAPRGTVGIYFGNWYTDPIVARAQRTVDASKYDAALARINAFERALVDDGALIVKLWFHLSKRAQRTIYDELLGDKRTKWRVTKADLENHRQYGKFRAASERALRETSLQHAPWTIVEAQDKRFRQLTVGETLRDAFTRRLAVPPPERPSAPKPASKLGKTILDTVDLSSKVKDDDAYDDELEALQGRLNKAFRKLKSRGGSAIAVFEGWDAAGKGGAIRRITGALDARDYRVIPVAAPTDEERAHHYLWRFWRHLPGRGKLTVYDRSWYGRVLVERVEGFARTEEWQRAYAEINEMEEELVNHGIVIAKLWLHIDADEQMRRFKERQKTEFKRFKITEEDWRNREKMPQYIEAVHEMVQRTSTEIAPWHLVGANDKKSARLAVLKHLCDRIERAR